MASRYTITAARPGDCPALAAIERAAGDLFRAYPQETVIDDSFDLSEFREAQASGLLWVALLDDTPVGFALVEMLASDLPHLEEIDVHPDHGRRGVGTKLLKVVCEWAARAGFGELTLTTFRDVPWNMPFYARHGFEEVHDTALRPELSAVVRDESSRGFDRARRLAMRYDARARVRPGVG